MKSFIANVAILAAIGLTSYGAWLAWPPLGFICGGVWCAMAAVGLVAKPET